MASKINRPRPATKLGLTSDVRSGSYQTRDDRPSMKPGKVRSVKSRALGKGARR